jgi:hypothetical protein
MSIIAEYQFLRRDKRFEAVLSGYEKNELNTYFEFDEYTKTEIEELINLIRLGKSANVYERLTDLEIKLSNESMFLGKLRTHAAYGGMPKEKVLAADAMKKIIDVVNLIRNAGTELGRGKRENAIKELEKAKSCF